MVCKHREWAVGGGIFPLDQVAWGDLVEEWGLWQEMEPARQTERPFPGEGHYVHGFEMGKGLVSSGIKRRQMLLWLNYSKEDRKRGRLCRVYRSWFCPESRNLTESIWHVKEGYELINSQGWQVKNWIGKEKETKAGVRGPFCWTKREMVAAWREVEAVELETEELM